MRIPPLLVALLLTAWPADAQVEAPSLVTLTWENDLLAGRDQHYTNGIRFSLTGEASEALCPRYLRGHQAEWGLAVGQEIYTPEDTERRDVIPDDRPYAGWAYVGASLRRRNRALLYEDRIELTLGILGPASGAEAAHRLVHDLVGASAARGWNNQLADEPGVQIRYRFLPRISRGRSGPLDYELSVDLEAALGNVMTHASLGFEAKLGLNVPDRFAEDSPSPLRLYLIANAKARLVAHDVFLDGSLLHSGGHRVTKELLVFEVALGVKFRIADRVSFTYVHTYRSPQFEGQSAGNQFGSINVGVSW